ncbi:hypothetical protein V8F20_001064 [Naviculisporaceae sp. PSN 640]
MDSSRLLLLAFPILILDFLSCQRWRSSCTVFFSRGAPAYYTTDDSFTTAQHYSKHCNSIDYGYRICGCKPEIGCDPLYGIFSITSIINRQPNLAATGHGS